MIGKVIHFFFTIIFIIIVTHRSESEIQPPRLNLIYKEQWESTFVSTQLIHFKFPVFYYGIDTIDQKCHNQDQCIEVVKNMQIDHIRTMNHPNIAYNFLIDERGIIYEGTGWYYHSLHQETEFLSICLFGLNSYPSLSKEIKSGLDSILNYGKYYLYLTKNVTVLPRLITTTTENSLMKTHHDLNNNKQNSQFIHDYFFINNNERSKQDESKSEDLNDSEISKDGENIDNMNEALNKINATWIDIFPVRGSKAKVGLERVLTDQLRLPEPISKQIRQNRSQYEHMNWTQFITSNHQKGWDTIFGDK